MSSLARHRGRYAARDRTHHMWAALAIAIVLHAGLLLVKFREIGRETTSPEHVIELSFARPAVSVQQPRPTPPVEAPKPPVPPIRTVASALQEPAVVAQPAAPPPPPISAPAAASEELGPEQVRQLARTIIASPFLEDADDTRKVFGKEPEDRHSEVDFRVPDRPDMFSMLEGPPIDLPFADPELVEFAYAPGAMGAIERGFDRITPEFGWTSNSGFKIRCRWVLIVVGCGWGR